MRYAGCSESDVRNAMAPTTHRQVDPHVRALSRVLNAPPRAKPLPTILANCDHIAGRASPQGCPSTAAFISGRAQSPPQLVRDDRGPLPKLSMRC